MVQSPVKDRVILKTLKREILALSQELRCNVMDKIWDRNTSKSEVIVSWGRDEKKRMTKKN